MPNGGTRTSRYAYPYSIMVNIEGQRFVDEGSDIRGRTCAKMGRAILAQPSGIAYQIFDAQARQMGLLQDYDRNNATGVKADSLDEAAKLAGLDPAAVAATVRAYNAAIGPGELRPDPFRLDHNGYGRPDAGQEQLRDQASRKARSRSTASGAASRSPSAACWSIRARLTCSTPRAARFPACTPACGEMLGGLWHWNYPSGSGMMARRAVFGKIVRRIGGPGGLRRMTPVALRIAEFVLGVRDQDVPAEDRAAIETSCFDLIGALLAGRTSRHGQLVEQLVRAEGGSPECTVLGAGLSVPAVAAVLSNATAAHADDFDDMGGYGHPSAPLLPALLAAAELRGGASGQEIITAYAAGFEVGAALCQLGRYDQYARCFHSTPVFGSLAAACAVARLLELDPERTAASLAAAATFAAGVGRNSGTMVKPLHVGQAAAHAGARRPAGRGWHPRSSRRVRGPRRILGEPLRHSGQRLG